MSMDFLNKITELDLNLDIVEENILSLDVFSDEPEAVVLDIFDEDMFIEISKNISKSKEISTEVRNTVENLRNKNLEKEYVLFKDVFYSLYLSSPQLKTEKTTNVTQLFSREILTNLYENNYYRFIRKYTEAQESKSFVTAREISDSIIKDIENNIKEELENILEEAQSKYYEILLSDNTDENGENDSSSNNSDANKNEGGSSGNKQGETDIDSLPEEVKDKLRKAREMIEISVSKAASEAQRGTEKAEKALEVLGAGTANGSSFNSSQIAEQVILYEKLYSKNKIEDILKLLGQIKSRNKERWYKTRKNRSTKLMGISPGSEISNLISEEKFNLTDDRLEMELFLRLQEGSALVHKSKAIADQVGPMIFCLDESGSMSWKNRNIESKALALAMLDIAVRQKRKFATVHFSNTVEKIFYIKNVNAPDVTNKLLEIAGHFIGGGTLFTPPLKKALEIIEKENYMKEADIIFITDGEGYAIDLEVYEKIKSLKASKKLKLVTILISDVKELIRFGNNRGLQNLRELSSNFIIVKDLLEAENAIFNEITGI